MSVRDDLALVVGLACLTGDRTNQEQHALLRVAAKLDSELNAHVVTNKRDRSEPSSQLLVLVEETRVLEEGQRAVALPAKTLTSWESRVQRWETEE